MIERTLVLIKPDGVQRGLIGNIISRFENAGLKVVGMKMAWIDKKFAKKHYTDDISKRRGVHVRNMMLDFIIQGPVVAIVLEGIEAIHVVRKLVGDTEPKTALPGTIRGDFTHHSFKHSDNKKRAIANVIHASSDKKDAKNEINLWFSKKDLHSYKVLHEHHTF
jgi:nucleoside-diphosphate kinase